MGLQGIGIEFARLNQQRCYDIDECNDGRNGGGVEHSQCVNTEVRERERERERDAVVDSAVESNNGCCVPGVVLLRAMPGRLRG